MMEALARLTPAQRGDYIKAQRSLEDKRSKQRLVQLDEAQRCLTQASTARSIRSCMQALNQSGRKLREEQLQQQQLIAQRFGLPQLKGAGRYGQGVEN